MRHIITIIKKQIKDTLRNKAVLIQFVMFPALAVIMTRSMQIEGMPPDFFVKLFSTMYVGMAPLTCIAAIISEEKEKNTLRVLLMADVSSWQYLVGVGSYVFFFCMLGAGVFCLLGGYTLGQGGVFLLIMAVGILTSLLLGAAAQLGIFTAFLLALALGFTTAEAGAIGVIGGQNGRWRFARLWCCWAAWGAAGGLG